jgi:hypothetical protein
MIIELQTIPIYLTEHEAKMFLKFQKHFKLFELLEEKKAFDIKHGTVTIDFNGDGDIKGISKKQFFPL